MAARKVKTALTDVWKDRISATKLGLRLQQHAFGEIEMTPTQVQAARILLGKLIPDVARTEISGDPNNPIKTSLEVTFK